MNQSQENEEEWEWQDGLKQLLKILEEEGGGLKQVCQIPSKTFLDEMEQIMLTLLWKK